MNASSASALLRSASGLIPSVSGSKAGRWVSIQSSAPASRPARPHSARWPVAASYLAGDIPDDNLNFRAVDDQHPATDVEQNVARTLAQDAIGAIEQRGGRHFQVDRLGLPREFDELARSW